MAKKSIVEMVFGFWSFNTKVIVGSAMILIGTGIIVTGIGAVFTVPLVGAGAIILGDAFGVKIKI